MFGPERMSRAQGREDLERNEGLLWTLVCEKEGCAVSCGGDVGQAGENTDAVSVKMKLCPWRPLRCC